MINPSKYQKVVFHEVVNGNGDLVISAVAGSGKTTTIVECLKLIPPSKRTLFSAFNNTVVDELKLRCPSNVIVSTLHSIGWQSMKRYYGNDIKLNPSKSYMYAEKMFKYSIPKKLLAFQCLMLSKLIDLYKLNLANSREELMELADKHDIFYDDVMIEQAMLLLEIVSADTSQFDFADMVFVPAVLEDIQLFTYDYIFVDECQDLNRAQQRLLERSRKKGGRMISVGDPNQAIYGFAGADVESFNRLVNKKNTKLLPLSVCYRCSKEVVEFASKIVPTIEAYEKSRIGVVRNGSVNEIRDKDWVLCRNIRPLIMLCVDLINRGKKAHVKGAEIGKSIITLLKKTNEKSYSRALDKLMEMLESTRKELKSRGVADPLRHPKYLNLRERISVIMFLGKNSRSTTEIISKLERVFKEQTGGIQLSTIHKAKGLENDRIFLICPELMPSKYATQPWQLEQERNLQYVAYTRAKDQLIIVEDFKDEIIDFRTLIRKSNS